MNEQDNNKNKEILFIKYFFNYSKKIKEKQ